MPLRTRNIIRKGKTHTAEQVYQFLYVKKCLLDTSSLWNRVNYVIGIMSERHALNHLRSSDIAKRNPSRSASQNCTPYDFNRVQLTTSSTNPDGYIDASSISLPKIDRKYFLVGEIPESEGEYFWQLVVEQKVPAIITLSSCAENMTRAQSSYYPIEKARLQFPDHKIYCNSVEHSKYFTTRRYLVIHRAEETDYYHDLIHYAISEQSFVEEMPADLFAELHKLLIADNVFNSKSQKNFRFPFFKNKSRSPPSNALVFQEGNHFSRSAAFIIYDAIIKMSEVQMKSHYSLEYMILKLKRQRLDIHVATGTVIDLYESILHSLLQQYPELYGLNSHLENFVATIQHPQAGNEDIFISYIHPKEWFIDNKKRDLYLARSQAHRIALLATSTEPAKAILKYQPYIVTDNSCSYSNP